MIETSLQHHEPVALPARTFARVARSVAGYGVMLALMLLTPLFVFVPTVLFHCGIRNGRRAAAIALIAGAAASGLLLMQVTQLATTTPAEAKMSLASLLGLVATVGIASLIVLPRVERGEAFGRVLVAALLISIGGIALTEAGMRAASGFSPYQEQVVRAEQSADEFIALYGKGLPPDAIRTMHALWKMGVACLPALFLIQIVIVFVLSLVMFGRLKSWREVAATRQAGTPADGVYLFRNLALPEWLLFAFVLGGLTPLVSGLVQKVAGNVLAVTIFLYLLQGLAVFRWLLAAVGAGFTGIVFGYVMLAFLTILGVAPLLLTVAGLFDSFFNFRKFRKDSPDESHSD